MLIAKAYIAEVFWFFGFFFFLIFCFRESVYHLLDYLAQFNYKLDIKVWKKENP